jgi:hypothetical protein
MSAKCNKPPSVLKQNITMLLCRVVQPHSTYCHIVFARAPLHTSGSVGQAMVVCAREGGGCGGGMLLHPIAKTKLVGTRSALYHEPTGQSAVGSFSSPGTSGPVLGTHALECSSQYQ